MRTLPAFSIGLILTSLALANAHAAVNYQKLPLSFEPNRGQAGPGVEYVARGTGYFLTIDPSGSQILLRQKDKSARISSKLAGGNPHPKLEALDLLRGHSAYFRGADPSKWLTNIPNYVRVRASGVYPGIDLIYYGNQSSLEYDFVVNPGADPRKIRMQFDGVQSLRAGADGNLILSTPAGDIVQQKPAVYQTIGGERHAVAGRFAIHGRRFVSFELASYDR